MAIQIPEVSDAECAFGGAMKLLPKYQELPEEFKSMRGPYCEAVSQLFFSGGKLSDHGLTPKDGIEEKKVYRVLKACISDWSPSHEHKIGGTAFLLSQWYDHKPETQPA